MALGVRLVGWPPEREEDVSKEELLDWLREDYAYRDWGRTDLPGMDEYQGE